MPKKGFTLIDLIIVVIIVGILAAISAPMMSMNIKKAKAAEAMAALGAIRTAERLYYADKSAYVVFTGNLNGVAGINTYLSNTDINGKYFNVNAYSVNAANIARVNGNISATADTNGTIINMDLVTGNYNGY